MKNLFLAFVLLCMSHFMAAQTCLPGFTVFTTQAQIDNFAVNNPGCTQIGGTVFISGAGITNLNGLSVVSSIGGSLTVIGNSSLTSLNGLDNLVIGGSFTLEQNDGLTNLTGLNNLTIEQDFHISNNLSLKSLMGFTNTSVEGLLRIIDNNCLTNLNGLQALTTVNNLTVQNNTTLVNLSGLDNLQTVTGTVKILANLILANLTGLGSLASINQDLLIENNYSLASLNGMNTLDSIGGRFNISNNPALTNLEGLDNLSYVKYFDIGTNNNLVSLSGLDSLAVIGEYLNIFGNPALRNLDGLQGLETIVKDLIINDNDSLKILSELANLHVLDRSLIVTNNDNLGTLSGLDNIDYTTLNNVQVYSNPKLSHCKVQSLCDFLANGGAGAFGPNGEGCNSASIVMSQCSLMCTTLTNPLPNQSNVLPTASLSWLPAPGATGYKLDIGTTPNGTDILNDYDVGNVTTFNPPGDFPFGLVIFVTIKPYDGSMTETGCFSQGFKIVDLPACTNLTSPANGSSDIPVNAALRWTAIAAAAGYRLDVGTTPGGTDILNDYDAGNVTTYNPPGDFPPGLVYVKIKPYNVAGINTGCSNPSFTVVAPLANPSCQIVRAIRSNSCLAGNPILINVATAPGSALGVDVSLSNVKLAIEHFRDFQVNISLVTPSGVRVNLSCKNGGEGDHYGDPSSPTCSGFTNLSMSASTPITTSAAPFIGDYLPEGNFADFNDGSNPVGVWTLDVCSDGQSGVLKYLELVFAPLANPPGCTNLSSPANAATNVPVTASLNWTAAAAATGYRLNVGTTPGGIDILNDFDAGNVLTYNPPGDFPLNTTIYVKIKPYNANGTAVDCPEESFTTAACQLNTFYADSDSDTYGNLAMTTQACSAPAGYVANDDDCDDANAGINPAASEICNNEDDDCSGSPEAATNTWTGSGDGVNWSDAPNWSDGIVPLACQDVVIPAGFLVTVAAGVNAVGKTLDIPFTGQLQVDVSATMIIQN